MRMFGRLPAHQGDGPGFERKYFLFSWRFRVLRFV